GGGCGREFLHSIRRGRACRTLAAFDGFVASLHPLFRVHLWIVWALQSEVALHLVARSLQHRARRDRAGGDTVGARLRVRCTERLWYVLFRQDHDRPLLAVAGRVPVPSPPRLSLFSFYSRASALPSRM